MPQAWKDLIEALQIMGAKADSDNISPFHCEHDTLTVMVHPAKFSEEELAHLDELGFFADESDWGDEVIQSYRYGSA